MKALKIVGWVVLSLALVVNIVYWQDAWFWRRYVMLFDPTPTEGLKPFDLVQGDGRFVVPIASLKNQTVTQGAMDEAVEYAKEFNSYAVLAIHNGEIQLEWYADGRGPDDLTESQSMHKTLMGLFVGIAIEDGYIESVDDPVSTYIEEWRADPRGDVTLKNLMQMSSGLGQYPFGLNPFNSDMDWLYAGNTTEPLLNMPNADWEQGTRYEYNNLNSELLGLIIERASGKRYADYLEEKLWRPMGGDRAQVWLDSEGGAAHTSCCLATPAMDWARFGMMLLGKGEVNGNRIVSEAWIDEMVTRSPSANHYGYQTWLGYDDPPFPLGSGSTGPTASEPYLARDTFLTWGRGQQHVWVSPSMNLVVLRIGPALGRSPIKPGFDVPKIPNIMVRGIQAKAAQSAALEE
ncbi:MAG: serine hydrolase [Rhodospirillaceae bacterium]|jgi:CubicO group peptidase (beta-lactamase class C family)|nr:serine hydrolase [Rhodospirillaceae bacterium]MBT5241305.1 serine hydrolase [Rhodospirillaceae bacterium]MBT5565060.1 serine hydrolase [Rhodospirillaceae bacterium]MBT6088082.1 serine hydrolase [Rhodospirillaceae bacterium]MBT7451172.1 serine hydrolase [Rhodospirillaceae bacterium]